MGLFKHKKKDYQFSPYNQKTNNKKNEFILKFKIFLLKIACFLFFDCLTK